MTDKIQTTDCYVPVSLKERLPINQGFYHTLMGVEPELHFCGETGLYISPEEKDDLTHWLEKKEGVIVLTVSQMEKILGDAFEAGEKHEFAITVYRQTSEPCKDEYIKTLLP